MTTVAIKEYPNPLKESVGNNQPNLGEDLRKIKRGLSALGIVEDDTSEDFITRALDTGIKVFQKDNGLKVDGILRPGGETERSLFETLTQRPSEELFGPDPMKSTGIGIGFGTGISTLDQLQEATKKSGGHVFTYVKPREDKPSPSNGIIKNLQGQDTPSQPRDIFSTPEPEEQLTPTKQQEIDEDTSPVQYDATGRMISPTQSGKTQAQAQKSVPTAESQTASQLPDYKKDWFKTARPPGEWDNWAQTTESDTTLSSAEKKAYRDIFTAEGGMAENTTSGAVGGMMPGTLEGLEKQGYINDLVQKHGANVKPTDLDMDDVKKAYNAYFDDAFKGAARTAGIPGQGHKMLGTIGDDEIASATADTLFRDKYEETSKYVQRAINKALPEAQHVETKGGPGSETLNGLREIAKDPAKKRVFLDALADERDKNFKEPGDPSRTEYFRFKK